MSQNPCGIPVESNPMFVHLNLVRINVKYCEFKIFTIIIIIFKAEVCHFLVCVLCASFMGLMAR